MRRLLLVHKGHCLFYLICTLTGVRVGEMVENLSVLKRRPEKGHLYLVDFTKQKDNIIGSFSKVLWTPAKERVLIAT